MEHGKRLRSLYSWLVLGVFLLLPPITFGSLPWYTAPVGALVLLMGALSLARRLPGMKKLIPLALVLVLAHALALYGFLTEGEEGLFTRWSQWAGALLALCFLCLLWWESRRALKAAYPQWRDRSRGPILRYVAVSGAGMVLSLLPLLMVQRREITFTFPLNGATGWIPLVALMVVLLFLNLHMLWGVWALGRSMEEG